MNVPVRITESQARRLAAILADLRHSETLSDQNRTAAAK